jgi:hypothetical protein
MAGTISMLLIVAPLIKISSGPAVISNKPPNDSVQIGRGRVGKECE